MPHGTCTCPTSPHVSNQAWSVEHLERPLREHNYTILGQVAVLLLQHADLHCEVHGRTSTPVTTDPDLTEALLGLGADGQARQREVMDRLAQLRAEVL